MRFSLAISAMLFLCGCMDGLPQGPAPDSPHSSTQPAPAITTTSTVPDDFAYYIPSTTSTQEQTVNTLVVIPSSTQSNPLIRTFKDNGGKICNVGGKPLVRMFGNFGCVHCEWGGPIFDKVVREYSDRGMIIAHHWLFDRNDDALTPLEEGSIPDEEVAVFMAGNQTTVPYFSLGCRFTRVGNGYYVQNQPLKEENELRAVLDQILSDKDI